MHDVQPINGVVNGRVLLKRLTHHHQQQQQVGHHLLLQPQPQQQQQQQQQQQALKCPRCDSLNTKFCYYNNYNLSQPRHFCKNCRRYWTKGGVLRNVPVGGGCRKSKRSSSSSVTSKHKSSSYSKKNNNDIIILNNNSTNSSSESSSTNTDVGGGGGGGGGRFQIPEVENYGMTCDLEPLVDSTTSNLFSGEIGGFMNLISNNNNDSNFDVVVNDEIVNGNVSSAAAAASFTEFLQNQGVHDWDMGKICGVHQHDEKIGGTPSIDLVDPTVTIDDFLQNRASTVGLTPLDWHLSAANNSNDNNNQGMLDVSDNSCVDHQAYWSQSTSAAHHNSQWSDSTTSHLPLFLP